jgi:DNA repair protein RecO (recombination protein O)
VALLATQGPQAAQLALRAFELLLLQGTGHLPALNAQTANLQDLQDQQNYTLTPEGGLRSAEPQDRQALPAAHWWALQEALQNAAPLSALLQALGELPIQANQALKRTLRVVLNHHCGVEHLRTRQVMMALQNL